MKLDPSDLKQDAVVIKQIELLLLKQCLMNLNAAALHKTHSKTTHKSSLIWGDLVVMYLAKFLYGKT